MRRTALPKISIQHRLEALRGAAALFVVIHHIIVHNRCLDPNYFPEKLRSFEPPGHFCVLIFFVLSGYVIGVSNKKRLTSDKIFVYLKKRFLRIYPIYFVSLSIALLIAAPYPISTIVSNYTLTQGIFSPVVWENNPIWSLNYEVLYYLLFVGVSYFNIDPLILFLGSVGIALTNYALYPALDLPILSSYFYGFAFWCTGLVIARYFTEKENMVTNSRLLSGIFLILSFKLLTVTDYLLHKAASFFTSKDILFPATLYWDKTIITFYDLYLLPYSFFLVLLFSEKKWRYGRYLAGLLLFMPWLTLINQVRKHYHDPNFYWAIGPSLLCLVASTLLYHNSFTFVEKLGNKIVKVMMGFGSISYGLYIIHMPILLLFGKLQLFSGTGITFAFRLISYLVISIGTGYLLEKKFQPWIVQRFDKKVVADN